MIQLYSYYAVTDLSAHSAAETCVPAYWWPPAHVHKGIL